MNATRASAQSLPASRRPCWVCRASTLGPLQHSPATQLEPRRVRRRTALHHESLLPQRSTVGNLSATRARQSQFVGPQPCPQSWRLQADHAAAGNTNNAASHAAAHMSYFFTHGSSFSSTRETSLLCTAWPNPSVKRSANGVPPGPRYSAGVHFLQRGPGGTPLSPAYLKR